KEFQMLMKSKDNFLKKVSSAERIELETLYGLLIHASSQNNTEALKAEYEMKLNELTMSAGDGSSLKAKLTQRYLRVLMNEEQRLEKERQSLKDFASILKAKKESLRTIHIMNLSKSEERLTEKTLDLIVFVKELRIDMKERET